MHNFQIDGKNKGKYRKMVTDMKQNVQKQQKSFSVRTDLAIEARELAQQNTEKQNTLDGVLVSTQQTEYYTMTTVHILNETGSQTMGKPQGTYITIESAGLKENDTFCHEEITNAMANALSDLAKPKENAVVLVVGLGNWNITPDALGPKVVSKVLVTRHLKDTLPPQITEKMRPVAAVSPGVMGITGIETGEIVKGIVEKLKPDFVIAIDALAARKTSRINAAIQLSDTGIAPGAGVGNKRKLLNEETLGVPVIAVGVPTVVDAATLVNDTMDKMLSVMREQTAQTNPFYQMLTDMETEEKYTLISELLNPYAENMFVTPKEVDAVIERLSRIIANAINVSLQPQISLEDMNRYTAN